MLRILGHHHGSRTAGQEIEIVDVITRSSDHGMIAVPHQNCVAIVHLEYRTPRAVGAIKVLEGKGARLLHAVVIDLIQVYFGRRVVDLVLVRGITGPIATGGVDLDHH
jgi:hypothetical protein